MLRSRGFCAAVGLVVLTSTACDPGATTSGPTPSSSTFSPTGDFDAPTPDPTQRAAVLDELRAVDPTYVADPERAVLRATNVCRQIHIRRSSGSTLVRYVREEFGENGRFPSEANARRIAAIVRTTFCST